jgi:asparagine synthase (glutamine-hydrolysing)
MVEAMCQAQRHRGPDLMGAHISEGAGLGIQRLRVIDLDTGDQPIYNEDRSIAVVLNGEIYNYRELRERLRERGHELATKGDTEVIAHLYEDLGPECVKELKGMFSYAIWDAPRRRLVISRDRLGKKPLHYHHRDGAISFASEVQALLRDPEVPREVDPEAIDAYLAYGYVPAPMSAFSGVKKLPPGSTLVYEDGGVSIERYWRLRFPPGQRSEDSALHEEIRERIRAAVRSRMISDVPLGAFLSGGIDSSTVVAAMAEASSEPVKTFSIGFEEEEHSELPNARLIAERFGTDHSELVIRPDVVSILPKVARHYGEPFADPSAVPSFYVSEMARRAVTVALNGDGGDESFAGYNHYLTAARTDRIAGGLPGPVRRAIGSVAGRSALHGEPARALNRARRLGRYLALDRGTRYARTMTTISPELRATLYADEFAAEAGGPPHLIEDAWSRAEADCLVNTMLEVDIQTYLPEDLLVKVDIATMAYSLEARSPLLDHQLMEFAATLPGSLKLQGSEKKALLRNALRGWIPDQILDGPKRGFGLPTTKAWFRGELRGFITDVLTDPRAAGRGYFRPEAVEKMLRQHMDESQDHSMQLWSLMMLELWQREVVDQAA